MRNQRLHDTPVNPGEKIFVATFKVFPGTPLQHPDRRPRRPDERDRREKSISLTDAQIEEVAHLFATLAEPSRLRLLRALMREPMTVTELVEATGMKQGNVSKQLSILYDAHVLARNRQGNFIRYAIDDETIVQLCNLVCRKVESDALARVATLKGVLQASTKKGS
jgi:DNA-binding transcriptional ArsR family regulator